MADTALVAGNAAKNIIEQLGFEMADVEYVREDGQMCLNFYIRRPGGVNIEDCEAVSRAIDGPVEDADPTNGKPYCLCVSTWGDRPLKNESDFAFFNGTQVEVKLKKPVNGKKKKYVGVLIGYEKGVATVQAGEEVLSFENENVEFIRPYIGF